MVLKCKKEPLFIQQLIAQTAEKEEPDPKPFHISLNSQHLVIHKVRTLLHVCAHILFMHTKGEKKNSIFPLTDMHLTSEKTVIDKNKYQNTSNLNPSILPEESYREVSLKKGQKNQTMQSLPAE